MNVQDILLSQLILAISYFAYLWLAKNNKQFAFNRVFLLFVPLLSLLLPFNPTFIAQEPIMTFELNEIAVTALSNPMKIPDSWSWFFLFYVGGCVLSALVFAFRIVQLTQLDKSNLLTKVNGVNVYQTECEQSFSFWNSIYLSHKMVEEYDFIVQHELVHCKQKHSLDVFVYGLYKILFWWNPFIYLLEKRMQENHEFLADFEILQKEDVAEYSKAILSAQFNTTFPHYTTGFNAKSTIEKRFIKMKTQNNNIMKHVFLVPALAVVTFALTSMEFSPSEKTQIVQTNEEIVQPQFKGGNEALVKYINENFNYSNLEEGARGNVYVQFTVEKNGELSNIEILKGSEHKSLNREALRFVESMPDWIPGTKNGKPVAMKMQLPIKID